MMTNEYPNFNDPMENQFRKNIKSWEASPPNSWDTPSPELWSKIAPTNSPPARPLHMPLAWLSLLLPVALMILYFADSPTSASPKPQPLSRPNTAVLSTAQLPESSTPPPAVVPARLPEPSKQAPNTAPIIHAIKHTKAVVSAFAEQKPLSLAASEPSPITLSAADPIPALPMEALDLPNPLLPAPPSIKTARSSSHFFAGIVVTPSNTFRQIKAQSPQTPLPNFLRENESAAWTTEYGLRFGWQPNRRWAFSTGLSQYQVRQQASHRIRIAFDPARERPLNNNAGFEGAYNMTLPSTYGNTDIEVRMLRTPGFSQLPAGQQILLDINTDLTLKYFSVPFSTHYFFGSDRFALGLKAGMALNFLQSDLISVQARSFQRGFSSRSAMVTQRLSATNRLTLDYLLGAALWFQPAPSWVISAEPTFRNSLQPVVAGDVFTVRQYALGLQLGIQKKF
jgi:hypothetical protein